MLTDDRSCPNQCRSELIGKNQCLVINSDPCPGLNQITVQPEAHGGRTAANMPKPFLLSVSLSILFAVCFFFCSLHLCVHWLFSWLPMKLHTVVEKKSWQNAMLSLNYRMKMHFVQLIFLFRWILFALFLSSPASLPLPVSFFSLSSNIVTVTIFSNFSELKMNIDHDGARMCQHIIWIIKK